MTLFLDVNKLQFNIVADLESQPYYTEAMQLVNDYTTLKEYLGQPLTVKWINRGSISNTRIGKAAVTLDIPVRGPKDRALIHVSASKLENR